MKTKVLDAIQQYHMPVAGRHILVGFSGGSDSAALLSILSALRDELSFTLSAAHVNHGIRGAEAQRDEAFCVAFCEARNVPIQVAHYDIPALAAQTGESCEACGRRMRYQFFNAAAPGALIATAHNLDDSVETLFLNLARGTGLKGLTGIPPVRDNVIRPLINCSKSEITAYCAENNIPFVTDSTNLSDAYSRNKIRHGVLPVLQEINPSFLSCCARAQAHLRDDEAYLAAAAREYAEQARQDEAFSVKRLLTAPSELLGRVIFYALNDLTHTPPEAAHVRRVIDFLQTGGAATLNGGATVYSDGERLARKAPQSPPPQKPLLFYNLPEKVRFAEKEICFFRRAPDAYPEKKSVKNKKIHKEVFLYYIDCDKIEYPFSVRTKIDGDKFRPAGRGVTKSMKQLFLEKRIPPQDRQRTVILADRAGILCAEGFGVDERVAVTGETQQILCIEIRRMNDERCD